MTATTRQAVVSVGVGGRGRAMMVLIMALRWVSMEVVVCGKTAERQPTSRAHFPVERCTSAIF